MVRLLPQSASQTITVLISETSTKLTISAPAQAIEGQPFTINGVLTRDDTGAGINGQTVKITYNGVVIANVVTTLDPTGLINGFYEAYATIDVPGNYTLRAEFFGAEVAGLILSPSSITRGIGTGLAASPIIPIAILLGAVLVLSRK